MRFSRKGGSVDSDSSVEERLSGSTGLGSCVSLVFGEESNSAASSSNFRISSSVSGSSFAMFFCFVFSLSDKTDELDFCFSSWGVVSPQSIDL